MTSIARFRFGWSHRLQARVIKVGYAGANATLALLRECLWPRRRPLEARRICINRIGNVGDVVCALPAMHAVRKAYPNAHITLLTSPGGRGAPGAVPLLADAPWLDDLIVYHRDEVVGLRARLSLVKRLRQHRFDLWVELPPNLGRLRDLTRNMLVARACGVRWAGGWRLGTIRIAAQAQSEFISFPNEVERLMEILAQTGIGTAERVFALPLTAGHAAKIEELTARAGLAGARLAAIAPGAKRSTNRWPAECFIDVGRALAEAGLQIAVLGGGEDRELCARVADGIGDAAVSFAGRTSLLESCELLKRCSCVVCNDSGVQHLAAAVGTPAVSIFSFRDMRGKWWPHGSRNVVLQQWVGCHTCFLDSCPHDNLCLKKIKSQEVVAAALHFGTAIVPEKTRVTRARLG